ncbi:putative exosome complex component RRP46 [Apostichopus japonicus]|uniref:Exosome complex component RRP46 n=1 Tax=Stichopus japonicus TaxID=307972 RepID=A0A2G8K1Q3_STIJA|nr:putative exosome complex component RRP46 [Apostichopus japonicus]
MDESSIREITSEQTLLSQPDGSSNYSQGDSTVMVGIYGPADIKQSKEQMDRATVEVIFKPKIGLAGVREKAMETMISNTCQAIVITTMHPRSSITIVVQVIQDAGSLLSCCINAVCMALMDAGISMKCLVAAVSCAITDEGAVIVDPTLKVTEDASAVLHFAFDSTEKHLVLSSTHGSCTTDQYMSCLKSCQDACDKLFEFYRTSAERRFSKT